MCLIFRFLLFLGCVLQNCMGKAAQDLRVPPKVETNPILSSSYIPAAMQIIAHDTELMKYVIKPPTGTTTTSTTTMRPTPAHSPAIFAPTNSLRANFPKTNKHDQYVEIQQQPSGENYFDRYNAYLSLNNQQGRALETDLYGAVDQYLGKGFGDVLKLANRIDEDLETEDDLSEFSKNFEDSDSGYRLDLLREKRVPPTKAYVTLLTLYDMLNKESKRLMLNKYAGYTDTVLTDLVKFSQSTSSHQLRAILNRVKENGDTPKTDILVKIEELIKDLDQEGSYINKALSDIPPLAFAY
ncbi:unnamed protein product [Ceutorhynchus assimilis]|uniref:Uncharacterized protein n=1 Tax=Ceutorhynchus assimilis TaxID=467358 RepID=A0A9N9MQ63_9CUCU|nr:unnamed protein product [Ceutorhynchus assimilis]